KMLSSKMLTIFFVCLTTLSSISFAQNTPKDFVATHNAARAEVGVGPLTWSHKVANYAQNYANSRIGDCNLDHSGGPFGENLAEGYGSMNGSDAVKFWLTEKPNYDYKSNSCVNDECLHYTQIVWRHSVYVGCARAKCNNGWIFVTCNYDPPGNIDGQRPY
ncbi:Pathogenesis-related protein 1, partial [Quillaja saponaria]